MISKEEVLSIADATGLRPEVVEKDHVLGWLLAAANENSSFADSWVFKGGTCLKKCYFETYRFSEDLDFTLQDESHLDEAFLKAQFSTIADWLYEESGIEIPKDRFTFDIYKNPRGHTSCEGRVYYQSHFSSSKHNIPKIKFDLTADEILVMPATKNAVIHNYSDAPQNGIYINCYSYPEVFGEKVRALGERGRPRDLYDVINLYRNNHLPAAAVIQNVLAQKCNYKGIAPPTIDDMGSYQEALIRNWEPMLGHQLPSLPAFEVYWDALPEFFKWLEGEETLEKTALGSVTSEGAIYQPAYGQLNLHALNGDSLEIIRFAAGNRLCVDLDYSDNSGNRSSRVIEPYSLRQAQNGNILLYAVRADDAQIRAYKINQINSASVVNRVFTPRYQVELTPTENLPAIENLPSPSRKLGTPRASAPKRARPKSRLTNPSNGPSYVYRCPFCERTFKRKQQNSKLNPHKTKDGWPCSGTTGYLESITY